MRHAVFPFALCLTACGSASAPAPAPQRIALTNLWAQPMTAAADSAAIYMTVTATCPGDDVLEGVSAAAPLKASLHDSAAVDGALQMKPVASIPVACGKPVTLKPMGQHIMLTGIGQRLGIGTKLPLTLRFRTAGEVPATAEITSMAVLEDVNPMHKHMDHSGGAMKGMGNSH